MGDIPLKIYYKGESNKKSMDNLRVDKIVSPQPGNNNSSYLNTKLSDGKKEHSKEQTDNEFKRFLELETKKLDSNKK